MRFGMLTVASLFTLAGCTDAESVWLDVAEPTFEAEVGPDIVDADWAFIAPHARTNPGSTEIIIIASEGEDNASVSLFFYDPLALEDLRPGTVLSSETDRDARVNISLRSRSASWGESLSSAVGNVFVEASELPDHVRIEFSAADDQPLSRWDVAGAFDLRVR